MKKDLSLKFKFIFIFSTFLLESFLLANEASALTGEILLSDNLNDYTIENDYYKAVIPKQGQCGAGIIKYLYIKKQNGEWSNNLTRENPCPHGLGFLEGAGEATINRCHGIPADTQVTISILENTPTRITIESTKSLHGTDFSEIWTFWADKPYFQSKASAVVTQDSGYLTNQLQFCWMINDEMQNVWYGTDKDGNITQFTDRVFQPINSPNLNTYPWINWQFTDENVSLGLIFTDVYNYLGTIGETGDWKFEYQLDFDLGSGPLGSPVNKNYTRSVTTIYYTADQATNTNIANFAQNSYQNATPVITQNPIIQSAQYVNDPWAQNPGYGSALLNSPYFLVRQNMQNHHRYDPKRPQYETSIYAPLYKNQKAIHPGWYDFQDQLEYSLNYNDGTTTYTYGPITSIASNNSSYETSLEMGATSTDSKLTYNSIFKTWSDSDKLQITGTVATTGSALVKNIYVSFKNLTSIISSEAESGTPTSSITSSLTSNDNLWTNCNYGFDSGTTLIYRDNMETVPSLSISVPPGQYKVIAYVLERPEGAITYQYSIDNSVWHSFSVDQAAESGIQAVDLGIMDISSGVFYIDDDNDGSNGIAGWAGWDRVDFHRMIKNLGSGVYDIQFSDDIYDQLGIAIKVNSPTDNISIVNGDLYIYLYSTTTAQTLTNFSYPFDIVIWPHKGWLNSSSDFTSLHSRDILTYDKRSLYIPEGIHTGRTNTIYSTGVITYSTDPYSSSTLVNMTVLPSEGSVNTTINTWDTTSTYYKKWTESASGTLSVDHVVGDLKPNTYYTVSVDSSAYGTYLSNSSGVISFTYTGSYSDHVFEVKEDTTGPDYFSLSSPANHSSTSNRKPTFSWNASSDSESGLSHYQLYIDDHLDTDNITGTSVTPTSPLSCSSHTWYVKAIDNAGNSTKSSTYNLTIVCGGLPSQLSPLTPPSPTLENPKGRFRVLINQDAKYTDNPVVTLNLFGGPDAVKMVISNNPEFAGPGSTGKIPYKSSYKWNLCRGRDSCPEGEYKVYVQFFAPWGKSSRIVSDSIIYRKEKPTFTRNLFIGMRGEDVRQLQKFLNSQGFVLAETGPGSPGNETTYFGPLTHNAVIRFQEKYASEILAPWGLTKGTGYVGKTTRAKINKILRESK